MLNTPETKLQSVHNEKKISEISEIPMPPLT